ncbi:MAG: DUF1559 domain-containing protein [Thermoguttaceae bacterium]|nr:DUF1559 domain-containing protein [Thermoguttaceae bacterium]
MTTNPSTQTTHANHVRAFTVIELLMTIIIISMLVAMALPCLLSSRENARRLQCTRNIANLGMAVRDYEETHGFLPVGCTADKGPIRNVPIGDAMGWLPRILPQLQLSGLYNTIDFTHSIYSEANQSCWLGSALLNSTILFCPNDSGRYLQHTPVNVNYAACHGNIETPVDSDNNGAFVLNGKIHSGEIPRGTTNTLFIGETILFYKTGSVPDAPSQPDTCHTTDTWNKFTIQWPPEQGPQCHPFVLGWMSGSGATLRNTASAINVITGPFAPDNRLNDLIDAKPLPSKNTRPGDLPVFHADQWAKPKPLEYLVGGFSSYHPYGANLLMGDCSVRYTSANIDLSVYQQLGSCNLPTEPKLTETGNK